MKYVALLVCLFTGFAFASPCPASGTLDSYISLGSTGCEDSHGTVLHDVTFTSATIDPADVTLTLGMSGSGAGTVRFDFDIDLASDSFSISYFVLRPSSGEPQWSLAGLYDNGVLFIPTGTGGSNTGHPFEFKTFISYQASAGGSVPEPSSLIMLISGAAGIWRAKRRLL